MNDDRGVSPRRRGTLRSRSRGQLVPVPLEALHVPVPRGKDAHSSLTSANICSVAAPATADSCRPAAPSDRTAAISVAISLPPRRIRAFRYPVRQQEQRDRRLMRYLRGHVYSPSPPTCPHAARCTHSRRVSLPSTSIEQSTYTKEHTSNACVCMRVCPHIARGRAKRRGGSVSATAYDCGRGKVIRTRKGRSLQLCCFFSNRDIRELDSVLFFSLAHTQVP